MLNAIEVKENIKSQFLKEEFITDDEQLLNEDFEIISDDDIRIIQYTFVVENKSNELILHQYIYRKFEHSGEELEHNRVLIKKDDLKELLF